MGAWSYQPEEAPKRKHYWENNYAGFVHQGALRTAKCPKDLSRKQIEDAMDRAIEWRPARWPHRYPKRLYTIIDGIVYRATPTVPGRSYHGFPEHPEYLADRRLKGVRESLEEMAQQLDCSRDYRLWMNAGKDSRETEQDD